MTRLIVAGVTCITGLAMICLPAFAFTFPWWLVITAGAVVTYCGMAVWVTSPVSPAMRRNAALTIACVWVALLAAMAGVWAGARPQ